jgi:hypothetical protein
MRLHALDDNGTIYRVDVSMCTNPENILTSMVYDMVLYNCRLMGNVHHIIKVSGGSFSNCYVEEVASVKINAKFRPTKGDDGDIEHIIDFNNGSIAACVDWVVPYGYRAFFCMDDKGKCFLFMSNPEDQYVMFPMSNCYEDGRVCIGNVKADKSLSEGEYFKAMADCFFNSRWNDHETTGRLFTNHNRFIFRWDENMEQLPMVDPETHLMVTNPSFSGTSAIAHIIRNYEKPKYGESSMVGAPRIVLLEEGKDDDEIFDDLLEVD